MRSRSMLKLWRKLRLLFHRKHERAKTPVSSSELLPPTESVASAPSYDLHPALAYVNTLDATQLSNLLTWILYFETVELPEVPVSWYQYIDPVDMRGWIMVGSFLVEHPNHGPELFVLDSICDRLALKRSIVYKYIKKLSDPQHMSWTQMTWVTREGESAGNSKLEVLELLQSALHEQFDIAEHVKPTIGSIFAQWQDEIITRVRGYLSQVIAPRIAHVRLGRPLLKGSTNEDLPKDVKQALRLTYLYETMLLERPVPLARYGIFPETLASRTQPDGIDDVTGVVDVDEDPCHVEASYSSTKLRSQNRDLRATLVHLQKKNGSLAEANEKLARKLATYGRQVPNAYTRPARGPHETSTFTLASSARAPAPGRSRSLSSSDRAAWKRPLSMVSEQPACAAATPNRGDGDPDFRRHVQDDERGSYEDLFKGLDQHPVLGRPLLHPATGQALSSNTTTSSFEGNCPTFRPPRPKTPHRPSSPRSSTLPPVPSSPMPPSPRSPFQYTYSSHSHPTLSNDASTPRYSPSRSSSTRSNITSVTGTTSRSSSNASRLSKRTASTRPGPCPLPAQPGRHNSIAEMQARQINVVHVQQPISPYAEATNPLDKARYAVTGIVRRKTSGVELRDGAEETGSGFGRKSSFARLGDVFGAGAGRGEGVGVAGARRGSVREADISKNF